MKKIFYIIVIVCSALLLPLSAVRAASFSFQTRDRIEKGRPFTLSFELNADGNVLNAVSGAVVWPDDLLEAKFLNDSNSLVNFWAKIPKIENNRIDFAGIVPGGFKGSRGQIFSIVFLPKATGSGKVTLEQPVALLSDGKATVAKTKVAEWSFISFGSDVNQLPDSTKADSVTPEEFKPVISSSPDLFNGAYFLVFSTQDKDSGIDYYEVQETRDGVTKADAWLTATSPYRLKDQKLSNHVWVKAVDNAGNIRVEKLSPQLPTDPYAKWPMRSLLVFLPFIGLLSAAKLFIVRRKKSHL